MCTYSERKLGCNFSFDSQGENILGCQVGVQHIFMAGNTCETIVEVWYEAPA